MESSDFTGKIKSRFSEEEWNEKILFIYLELYTVMTFNDVQIRTSTLAPSKKHVLPFTCINKPFHDHTCPSFLPKVDDQFYVKQRSLHF